MFDLSPERSRDTIGMARPASFASRETFHPELSKKESMSFLMFMGRIYREVNQMASTFTRGEMTGLFFGDNLADMGLLEDALDKIRQVAERDYGSLSGLARHLDKSPNLLTRWYADEKKGQQARKPKFDSIAPILEKLNFQLVAPNEKPQVAKSQDEIDRIWGGVSRLMREQGVDRDTIDAVGDIILGTEKRHRRKAAGE